MNPPTPGNEPEPKGPPASEDWYRSLVDSGPDAIIGMDDQGRIIEFNAAAQRIFCKAAEEVMGLDLAEVLIPATRRGQHIMGLSRYLATGEATMLGKRVEMTAMRADGTEFPIELVVQRAGSTNPPRFAGYIRDISDRKRSEQKLAESEARLRTMLDAEPECVKLLAFDGTVLEMNRAGLAMLEADSPAQVIGQNAINIVKPEHRPAFLDLLQRVQKGETVQIEFDVVGFKGTHRWLEMHAVPLRNSKGDITTSLSVTRDITDHKTSETALRESEARFRTLVEQLLVGIYLLQGDRFVYVNPKMEAIFGMTADELKSHSVFDLIAPEDREVARENIRARLSGDVRSVRYELRMLHKSGVKVDVEVHGSRTEYLGQPAVMGTLLDVTERKKAERALEDSEVRFHAIWETAQDAMRLTDENGTIVAVNAAFSRLVGIPREELEGKPFTVTYAGSRDPMDMLQRYRTRFRDRTIVQREERRMTLRSGQIVDLEVTSNFVELPERPAMLLGLFRNVTEHKNLEERLRHSQKMDSIGQLAGGVAHDFNNILTIIEGHTSLLLDDQTLNAEARESVSEVFEAAERAANLTRQLLTFSRKQLIQPKLLDLNEVVGNMTRMLRRLIGENITLTLNTHHNLPAIRADVGMVEQIIVNLVVNARDAMPKGGQLTIATSVLKIEKADAHLLGNGRAGSFVSLLIRDTGCGMTPEVRARLFEPFFTTKEPGKGTGLGLATIYGIVAQHDGWIDAESEPNQGTVFKVFLPAAVGTATTNAPTSPADLPGGKETILLVEDESSLRSLSRIVLEKVGYRVLEAASGNEALELWKQHGASIDLVFTDMVMPAGMNGLELARRLQALKPDLKMLFASGYSNDIAGPDFVLREGVNFLQKPYLPQTMARMVRTCLNAK